MDAGEFRNAFQVANSFSYIGNDYDERYVFGEKEWTILFALRLIQVLQSLGVMIILFRL